jgi:hypothetical protein
MRYKPTIRRSLALLAAVLMVTAVLGPVGTVTAASGVSVSHANSQTTVSPGDTVTITATFEQTEANSPAMEPMLPDGWTITSATAGTNWSWFSDQQTFLGSLDLSDSDGVTGTYTHTYTVQIPSDATAGDYTITSEGSVVEPASGDRLVDTASTTVTVEVPNTAPTIDAISDQTVTEGDSVTVPVSASDDDGDSVSLSLSQSPDFVTFSNGEITIAPQSGDAANSPYTVEVTADDGTDTATETFQLTVEEPSPTTGSALVEILPDSDNVDASTYGSGAYQVTNTGEKEITSVSFNLDTATLPDMVFDPQGTAGDPTGEGLNIVDEGGTGITTAEGGSEAFSQPHNGQNADDGYDVMTVEFNDFQNGETATFWADNDPTSIKGATVGSQEAGPVSGLELARSTVTVEYADGTTQTTQLMGDGSNGGSTAVVNSDEAPAPTIGAEGVSLDSNALDGYHSGATVTSTDQTVTITGQPGETFTLVQVEGELSLSNVPDADNDGEPGYEIEEYEANNAVNVTYYSDTFDSNGEATVPVTLTSSADDEAGFNYFVAAHGQASGDMGLASNVVVLKYEEQPSNTAPKVDAITDEGVSQGALTSVDVSASDAEGDSLSLSVSNGPSWATLTDNGDGTGTLTLEPGTDVSVGTYTVEVTASDGQATSEPEEFAVYVDEPDQDGTVVFAVNAGGSAYTATDGTAYQADTNFTGGSTYSESSEIGETEDDTLYQTERYGDPFSYTVGVENGTYEVTLQFAEIFQGVSSNDAPDSSTPPTDGTNENDRLFNATVEGDQKLTAYDIYSEAGALNATEKTYTVEVTDGKLTVEFDAINDNAKLSAMTVEALNEEPTASFGFSPNSPETGEQVSFDASGSEDPDGSIASYEWNFDDGDTAEGETATHTFDSAGDFEVTLNVTDDDGATAQTTQTVSVSEAPDPANFQVSNLNAPASATQGDNITVSADVTNDGDEEATQTVQFRLDVGDDGFGDAGDVVLSQDVELDPEESTTVEFTDIDTSELAPGDYTHGVVTDDDSATATISINEEPTASETSVSLSPESSEVVVGEVETYDVVVDNADGGVGAYELTVSLDDSSVASITDVELGGGPDAQTQNVTFADDGSSVTVSAALADTSDTGSVTIASVTVEGVAEGSSDLSVDVQALGNEEGDSYTVTEENGASISVVDLPPVGDFPNPPTDPDDDGLYEDVNGDGKFNIVDVQALFANLDDETVQNYPDAYDFNGDGSVDVVDVQKLYNEVLS